MNSVKVWVKRVDRVTSHLALLSGFAGAATIVLMAAHIILEVVLRTIFSTSTFAAVEYVGYGLAATTSLSAAYAFQSGTHIRMNLLLTRIRHVWWRQMVEFAVAAVSSVAIWFVVIYFAKSVARHMEFGTVSATVTETPLWIPEGLMLVGLVVFALRLSSYAVTALVQDALDPIVAHPDAERIEAKVEGWE